MAIACSPSLPQTVCPIPCSAVCPTTTVAAPSAKMKQLLGSSMSTVGDGFSEPITSILATLLPQIMSAATPTA